MLQFTGFVQSVVVIGPQAMSYGLGKWMSNPLKWHKVLMSESAWLKSRYQLNTWNKDVADTKAYVEASFGGVPTRSKVTMTALAHSYFWPIARAQMVIDEITWMAANWKGVNKKGLSDKDAILYADSVTENAQTSGMFSDRSGIERGTTRAHRQSQWIKIWTTLISYMLAKGNIAYAKGRQFARKPSLWGATTLAADVVMLFTVEAVLSAMIRGQFPGDDDEDDSLAAWLAAETAASAASGVPFIREIPGSRYGSGNTPLGSLAKDFYNAEIQLEQGEIDPAMIKAFNNVGGTLFHYPSTFLNRQFDAWYRDTVMGEDVEMIEYLTGKRKKE
jgi:hypothetical protein